jgi:hypothetical protein
VSQFLAAIADMVIFWPIYHVVVVLAFFCQEN